MVTQIVVVGEVSVAVLAVVMVRALDVVLLESCVGFEHLLVTKIASQYRRATLTSRRTRTYLFAPGAVVVLWGGAVVVIPGGSTR